MINCSAFLRQEHRDAARLHYTGTESPVIVWNLVSRCNLSCRHCYAESGSEEDGGIIPLNAAKEFIDDISSMKPPALLFSGGEPLLMGDIFELGYYAAKKGIYTALSTNGTLITEDLAKKIKNAGFKYVGISLDGLRAAHDDFRLYEGSFNLSLKGLDNCLREGIKTGVRFTLSKRNYGDLSELLRFLVERRINRFCLYHLVYSRESRADPEDDLDNMTRRGILSSFFSAVEEITGDGINMEILTVDNHADGVYLCHKLKRRHSKFFHDAEGLLLKGNGCSAGRGIASVDSRGDVHPCQFWGHVSLGNIKARRFSEIWQDKNNDFLNTLRNGRDRLKGRCGRCIYKVNCGGCRLRAERVYSDIWAEDPACYLTEDEIKGAY